VGTGRDSGCAEPRRRPSPLTDPAWKRTSVRQGPIHRLRLLLVFDGRSGQRPGPRNRRTRSNLCPDRAPHVAGGPPSGVTSPMSFDALGLTPELLRAVADQGYTEPTPVQREAIPLVLAGRDLPAGAQTGTGKTAAFVLPMLQRLADSQPVVTGPTSRDRRDAYRPPVRVLVLTPTRELALQVEASVRTYGAHRRVRSTAIYGGVGFDPQVR